MTGMGVVTSSGGAGVEVSEGVVKVVRVGAGDGVGVSAGAGDGVGVSAGAGDGVVCTIRFTLSLTVRSPSLPVIVNSYVPSGAVAKVSIVSVELKSADSPNVLLK